MQPNPYMPKFVINAGWRLHFSPPREHVRKLVMGTDHQLYWGMPAAACSF